MAARMRKIPQIPRRPCLADFERVGVSDQRALNEFTIALADWTDHQYPRWLEEVKLAYAQGKGRADF